MKLSKVAVFFVILLGFLVPGFAAAQTTGTDPERQVIPNPNGKSSQPPGFIKQKFGEWHMICDQPAGAPGEQCALIQNVVADDRDDVGLSVVVLKTADKKANILRILAPLGVLLPNGLGLIVDGQNIGRAYYNRCITDGCFVEVILTDDMLNTFRKGNSAVFIIHQTQEQGIGLPVDLTGFSDGFAGLE